MISSTSFVIESHPSIDIITNRTLALLKERVEGPVSPSIRHHHRSLSAIIIIVTRLARIKSRSNQINKPNEKLWHRLLSRFSFWNFDLEFLCHHLATTTASIKPITANKGVISLLLSFDSLANYPKNTDTVQEYQTFPLTSAD